MRVLLVSTYELGHQPIHLAAPTAALTQAGHDVRTLDLSVEPWDQQALEWADALACSVPMHTARRLAAVVVERARSQRPTLPICLYGLYAIAEPSSSKETTIRLIAGEYQTALVA